MYVLYVCVGGGTCARAADAFIPRYLREQGIPPHSIGIADGGVQGVDDAPGPFSLACSPLCWKSSLTWESCQRCILTTFPSFLGDNFVDAMPKSKQNYEYTTQARGSKSTRLEDQMPKRLSQDGRDARKHTKAKRANRGKGDTWETQMGQQRQRQDMRNNLSDIIGLGGIYKSKPKRQNRFMRFLHHLSFS